MCLAGQQSGITKESVFKSNHIRWKVPFCVGAWMHVYRPQVLSGIMFVNIYYNSLQCSQPLEPLRIVDSLNDVTVENSINLKLKLLLMGSFFIVVKLNCLLQDERSGETESQLTLICLGGGCCPLHWKVVLYVICDYFLFAVFYFKYSVYSFLIFSEVAGLYMY